MGVPGLDQRVALLLHPRVGVGPALGGAVKFVPTLLAGLQPLGVQGVGRGQLAEAPPHEANLLATHRHRRAQHRTGRLERRCRQPD